jgi:dTDP-glucose 4,6-dehydratase
MSKTIVITGSAGFIGTHLAEHILNNTDWNVVGIDSFKHRGDSLRVNQNPDRYTMYCHDLAAPISDRLRNKIGPVDYIVNMASESHVDRSITDPVDFVTNNIALCLNMLEYARKEKPSHFIQISTDEVYGAALNGINHKEWSTILPSNPYSGSKAAQEAIAISYWRTYNVPVIITNTMNNIGEYQDSEKFVPMLINRINAGEEVTIHGKKGDIGSRYYLHARNHADAVLFLLTKTKPTLYQDTMDRIIVPDRYNVVGEVELDNLELAEMIARILEKPLKYRLEDFHACRPGHDRRYALDGNKMQELGWKAPVPFLDSLKKTIAWTLERPEWLK